MTPETPTPETDAAARRGAYIKALSLYYETNGKQLVHIDDARKLERERDAARAEVEAMREAIKEARDVFVALSEYWNKDQNENAMADACWHTVETSSDALAKLEPFIKP